jgi:hypothetical protein
MSISDEKSVPGEDDLVLPRSPSVIGVGVETLPGPRIGNTTETLGISMWLGVCKLMDPRVLGEKGVLPDSDACCMTCWMELCGCVLVGGGSGEDWIWDSEVLLLGPKMGVPLFPSEASQQFREISG